ncbi:MAG TPA: hypothetical protein VII98_15385 [Solirubrobacteraceae bacterium]
MARDHKGRRGAAVMLLVVTALACAAPAAPAAKHRAKPVPDGYYTGANGGAQILKGKLNLGWHDPLGTQCTKADGPYTIQGQGFNVGLKKIPANGTVKVHDAFKLFPELPGTPIATQTGTLHVSKGAISGALKVSWTFDGGGCAAGAKIALHRTASS